MPRTDPARPDPRPAAPPAAPIHAMLIGAPKAGTTSLYRYVAQHPDVAAHPQRECTYFFSDDEFDRGHDACLHKYLPGGTPADQRFLAKHVFTMYRPLALRRLAAHRPQAPVFALLRDPVRRAYSSYWYSRRRGWEPAPTFEQAIDRELHQPDPGDDWLAQRDRMHLRVGRYHEPIRHAVELFGEAQVHVFLTEDLSQGAAGVCRAVFEALGVDADFLPDLTRSHNPAAAARSERVARTVAGALKSKGRLKRTVRRFVPHGLARRARHTLLRINEKPFTPPPMAPDTRRRLIDHFAPHNAALAALIGRDLSAWSEP